MIAMDLDGTILQRGLLTIRLDDTQNSQAICDWVKDQEVHLHHGGCLWVANDSRRVSRSITACGAPASMYQSHDMESPAPNDRASVSLPICPT
jgi:hypothetical protein